MMKKTSIAIAIQIAVFAILASAGIIYVLKQSPTEDLGHYEKREMVRPNQGKSFIDRIFSDSSKSSGEDMSLTGGSGRYEESRIGKPMPEPENK